MVKVITDKRECHCSAFNYCIDENCTRWAEIVNDIGQTPEELAEQTTRRARRERVTPEHRY